MRKPISQREARRLQERVAELEQLENRRRNRWWGDWPGGTKMCTQVYEPKQEVPVIVRTCRKLGHAVVVTEEGGTLYFYALRLASEVTR